MKGSFLSSVFTPVHVCLFGEPKSGKSLLAARLAENGYKLLWISIDNGHGVIFQHLKPELIESQFEFIRIPETTDFAVAYRTLLTLIQGKKCHICDYHGTINCAACTKTEGATFTDVCLDELQAGEWIIVLDHATAITKAASNKYLADKKLDPEEYKFEWEDWRRLGVMMDRIFQPIQQSRHHWVVLAHVNDAKQEDGKVKLFPAIGTGNYSRNSGGFFDHVVYCDVANLKHNFGSGTLFRNNVLTGSRSAIEIEKLKDGPSLVPFFDGTVKPKDKHYGVSAAKTLVAKPAGAESSSASSTVVSLAPAVSMGINEVSNAAAVVVEEPNIPAAGKATNMHEQPVNPSVSSAVERARALLRGHNR